MYLLSHTRVFFHPTTPNMLYFPEIQRMVRSRVVLRWDTTSEQMTEYEIGFAVTAVMANGSRKIVIRRLN